MLKHRILTAVIALPILIWVFVSSPTWLISLVILAITAFSIYEAASMILPACDRLARHDAEASQEEQQPFDIKMMIGFSCVLACLIFVAAVNWSKIAMNGMLIFGLLTTICVGVFSSSRVEQSILRTMGMLLAISYSVLPWIVIWEMTIMGQNSRYFFLLISIVWSGDTAAYFAGRYFGKRKLSRRSPNKTIEGALAGLLMSTLAAVALSACYAQPLASLSTLLLVGFFGGLLGQLGDLVESTIKRFAGVKDSGFIFPGHGGLLDRIDGLVFSAPFVWLVLFMNLG